MVFFVPLAPGMPNFPRPAGYLLVYGLGASLSDECYEKPDECLGKLYFSELLLITPAAQLDC